MTTTCGQPHSVVFVFTESIRDSRTLGTYLCARRLIRSCNEDNRDFEFPERRQYPAITVSTSMFTAGGSPQQTTKVILKTKNQCYRTETTNSEIQHNPCHFDHGYCPVAIGPWDICHGAWHIRKHSLNADHRDIHVGSGLKCSRERHLD